MQNIINAWFVRGMIKPPPMRLKGWDERNGGNLTRASTKRISNRSRPIFTLSRATSPSVSRCPRWRTSRLSSPVSGKFFRNVQLNPAANLGVVKVDSDGAGYHVLWD